MTEANVTNGFEELGVKLWLIKQLSSLGINTPTPIQAGCVQSILAGGDCMGGAKTGSGKTFAFALPILQQLAEDPYGIFALVLTPTHELAYQIGDQFTILGQPLNLRVCIVTGGSDQLIESQKLASRPHIVVAMPGRLADHIMGCDTFTLKKCKYLVLDEADRLFSESFESDLETIFAALPVKKQTLLFSATLTEDLLNNKHLTLNRENTLIWKEADPQLTVLTLDQRYVLCPAYARDVYLVQALRTYREENTSGHVIVFTDTKKDCQLISMTLNAIGMDNVCLHGFMRQRDRVAALAQFRSNLRSILIATNVAARGLDIPSVQLVVNHKLPLEPNEYIHRVGRTARAGRAGMAISLITPHDILRLGAIEEKINTRLTEYKIDDAQAVRVFTQVSVTKREQEVKLDNEDFDKRKRDYRRKNWLAKGLDVDMMEEGFEELRRQRIKAAKKAKLESIKQNIQSNNTTAGRKPAEMSDDRIDKYIKQGVKQLNRKLMKEDGRFKDALVKVAMVTKKTKKLDGDLKGSSELKGSKKRNEQFEKYKKKSKVV